jgi:hypothetical protein
MTWIVLAGLLVLAVSIVLLVVRRGPFADGSRDRVTRPRARWTLPEEMNPFRRLRDDKYRAFDEPVVRLRRHHPVAAVIPFVPAVGLVLASVLALTSLAFFEFAALAILVSITVDHLRRVPIVGSSGTGRTFAGGVAVVMAAAWVLVETSRLTMVALVLVASLGRAGYLLIEYFTIRLYLTDRRILRVSGLLNRQAATLPLRALTDVGFEETLLGLALGYGHFHVESAGQDQALSKLMYVEEHWDFYQTIMALAPPGVTIPQDLNEDKTTLRLARRWGISREPPGSDGR